MVLMLIVVVTGINGMLIAESSCQIQARTTEVERADLRM